MCGKVYAPVHSTKAAITIVPMDKNS